MSPMTSKATKTLERFAISFSGCGALINYHIGAGFCLAAQSDLFSRAERIAGCSGGALFAVLTQIDIALWPEIIRSSFEELHRQREKYFGSLRIDFNEYVNAFFAPLPADIHRTCSDRTFIATTRVVDFAPVVTSQFESREHLLEVLKASCFLPYLSGIVPPKIKDKMHIDGVFSKNIVEFDDIETIKISPISCQAFQISPESPAKPFFHLKMSAMSVPIEPLSLLNLSQAMTQPRMKDCKRQFEAGQLDALAYLRHNDLLTAETPSERFKGVLDEIYALFYQYSTLDLEHCLFEPNQYINQLQGFFEAMVRKE